MTTLLSFILGLVALVAGAELLVPSDTVSVNASVSATLATTVVAEVSL